MGRTSTQVKVSIKTKIARFNRKKVSGKGGARKSKKGLSPKAKILVKTKMKKVAIQMRAAMEKKAERAKFVADLAEAKEKVPE